MSQCECGCGGEARPGRRYLKGHSLKAANRKRKEKRAFKQEMGKGMSVSETAEQYKKASQSSSAGNFSQPSRPGTPDTLSSSTRMQDAGGKRNEATSDPAPVSYTDLQTEIKRLRSQVNRLAFGLFVSLVMNAVLLVIQVFPEVLK